MEKVFLNSDERFMKMALQEAVKAAHEGEVPVGAVVVDGLGHIVAAAHNMTQALNDVTAHAEMLSITAASQHFGAKYLKDCTIYVTVEPCLMCAGALAWSQIGRIVIGCRDEKRGFSTQTGTVSPFHPKTKVEFGVMADECGKCMSEFFSLRR